MGLVHLLRKIVRDVNNDAGSLSDWLDPWNAEQYLTNRWGILVTTTTAHISAQTLRSTVLAPGSGPAMGVLQATGSVEDVFSSSDVTNTLAIHSWSISLPSGVNDSSSFAINEPSNHPQYNPEPGTVPARHQLEDMTQYDLVLSSRSLVDKLCFQAVCFGEGPRFSKGNIDDAIQAFLLEAAFSGQSSKESLGAI